jgi:hypothetical protein
VAVTTIADEEDVDFELEVEDFTDVHTVADVASVFVEID